MSRSVPAAIVAGLGLPNAQPYFAVEMLFDSAPLRIWTGLQDRVIDGETYSPAGTLMGIAGLEEAGDLSARAATLTLSGISASIVSLALQEPYQGRRCRIFFGLRDVSEGVEVFSGLMNTMSIEQSGDTASIELIVDSKLVELERSRVRRYTHESQQARYPGDTGFSYVTKLQDAEVPWGRQAK